MQLKVNWAVLIFTVAVFGGCCGILGVVMVGQVIREVTRSDSKSWLLTIALVVACLMGVVWVIWTHYCFVKTTITDESISQARLGGTFTIAWSQVEKITAYGRGLSIYGRGGKIVLIPEAYINCHEVVEKMVEVVERHSIPFSEG